MLTYKLSLRFLCAGADMPRSDPFGASGTLTFFVFQTKHGSQTRDMRIKSGS